MKWIVALIAGIAALPGTNVPAAPSPSGSTVVIITLPGVTWSDVRSAHTPALDALIERGAVAALATRTAVGKPSADRGYLTLGAGNRAFLGPAGKRIAQPVLPDPQAQAAYAADDPVEGGHAIDALRRRVGDEPKGQIVHLGVAYLQARQSEGLYDANIGALGDALERADVVRGVVAAGDVAPSGDASTYRRAAVTSIMNASGTVDVGQLHGLLRRDPNAPFGVTTDVKAFEQAVRTTLALAGVVLVEPGETLRADEYSASVAAGAVPRMRRAAIERADQLIGVVESAAGREANLFVIASSPPSAPGTTDHLTPIVAAGPGIHRGWLTSPTTKHRGQVTLSDVAPTVLSIFGVKTPRSMIGRPMFSVADRRTEDRVRPLAELDTASVFREQFAAAFFWVIATVISLLAIVSALVLWRRRTKAYGALVAVAYFGLALFPAAFLMRPLHYWHFGQLGAHAALYVTAALLALLAWRVPGPRWAGGGALLLLAVALFTADALAAGPLQVNGVFGHSPVVAGRFYGIGNVGTTIIFCAAILGLMTLGELRGWRAVPWWAVGVLVGTALVDGLPQFGSDFGGLLTGVVAMALVVRLARGRRIDAGFVAAIGVAAVVVTAGASLMDLLRPPEVRTHLGRFAETIRSGGAASLALIVRRKAASQFGSFAATRWTFFLPVAIAGLAAVVAQPRGLLRRVLPERRFLRTGLWGTVVVGVVGFAVNDSGISITAVALALAIPLLVLFVVESVSPRTEAGRVRPPEVALAERVEKVLGD